MEKVNKIQESIPEVAESPYSRPFSGDERLCFFRPTTDDEVKEVIKLSGIKTSVEDPVPAKLLQSSLDIVIPIYTTLINKSLKEGSMEGVKSSVIDPLIKKANLDPESKKNFRPVNNLVFFSKLIERIVLIRLEEHMTKNNLHENTQFAYKTHHNTEMMMLGLFDEALRGFDNGMATIVIFLDLSAAFDTIDVDKLLDILYNEMGIDGVALKWFRSFLTGRTQRVKIGNEYSEKCEVPCGAPQGSVLGPRIFNINVRSQPEVFKCCLFTTSSFADDSNGRRTPVWKGWQVHPEVFSASPQWHPRISVVHPNFKTQRKYQKNAPKFANCIIFSTEEFFFSDKSSPTQYPSLLIV